MASTKIILIFGAGANTGLATVKKFASEGYKVAAVSRHPSEELKRSAHLVVPAHVNDPNQIEVVFEKVTAELGPPHVVVYNGEFASRPGFMNSSSLLFRFSLIFSISQ